jgi:hypothetical protein
MSICIKYGCDFALDMDGSITCTNCGGRDDDMISRATNIDMFESQVDFE